uniref:Putative salivary secreted mucin 3 n=1 Tax=Anopheles marajoara TaxID=58244 RepID=A0A2M4C674_9DIPT
MRQISVLLVVALTVATSFAYPASYEKDKESDTSEDAEYIVVPLAAQRPTYYNRYPSSFEGFDGVIDTGDFAPVPARPVYFPSYNPFSWHLSGYLDGEYSAGGAWNRGMEDYTVNTSCRHPETYARSFRWLVESLLQWHPVDGGLCPLGTRHLALGASVG